MRLARKLKDRLKVENFPPGQSPGRVGRSEQIEIRDDLGDLPVGFLGTLPEPVMGPSRQDVLAPDALQGKRFAQGVGAVCFAQVLGQVEIELPVPRSPAADQLLQLERAIRIGLEPGNLLPGRIRIGRPSDATCGPTTGQFPPMPIGPGPKDACRKNSANQ